MRSLHNYANLLQDVSLESWRLFWGNHAWRMAAGVAFYALFSLAPLLLLLVAGSGWIFSQQDLQHGLLSRLHPLIGEKGAQAVQQIMGQFHASRDIFSIAVAVISLGFGTVNALDQLRDSFNEVWKVPQKQRSRRGLLFKLLFYVTLVTAILSVMLCSFLLSWLLMAGKSALGDSLPGAFVFLRLGDLLMSLVLVTLICAVLFKFLPDAKIAWRDVWVGAAVTSVFFSFGKYGIALALGSSRMTSAYGAISSTLLFLLWVYYSTQIILIGASFTRVYAEKFGRPIGPEDH